MSSPEPHLEQIQRWMQSVIMHKGGVAEGVGSPEARQHIDVSLDELESVIERSRALSSANRLEIYVNAYYARLLECLDEEFAVTRWAMGEDLFGAVAFGYLQHYPSESYTLGNLGARFPLYLGESRLHASAAPPDAPPSWPEFIVELATFERLIYEVYDGTGTEQSAPFGADRLAELEPDDWPALRLIPSPALRLHAFSHAVHLYWSERKDGGEPSLHGPHTTLLALNRRDFVVEYHEQSDPQFALLEQFVAGATLSEALEATAAAGHDPGEADLGPWFAVWLADGFFHDFELESRA